MRGSSSFEAVRVKQLEKTSADAAERRNCGLPKLPPCITHVGRPGRVARIQERMRPLIWNVLRQTYCHREGAHSSICCGKPHPNKSGGIIRADFTVLNLKRRGKLFGRSSKNSVVAVPVRRGLFSSSADRGRFYPDQLNS